MIPIARDESRGKQAVSELEKEGLKPLYHQLDICNAESRDTLAKFIKEKYGGLDVLVNNAGIAYKVNKRAYLLVMFIFCIWDLFFIPIN